MFLRNCSRDSVNTFWCLQCRSLHTFTAYIFKKSSAEEKFRAVSNSWCNIRYNLSQRFDDMSSSCGNPLTLEHAQVAIKLDKHGLQSEAKKFLRPASINPLEGLRKNKEPLNRQFQFIEYGVQDGRLYDRTQTLMFVRLSQKDTISMGHIPGVCSDLYWDLLSESPLHQNLQCKFAHLGSRKAACSSCKQLIHCTSCCTEAQVFTKPITGSRHKVHAVILTVWRCIATGNSVFKRATNRKFGPMPAQSSDFTSNPAPGEIRDAFEQAATVPFQSFWNLEKAWATIDKSQISNSHPLDSFANNCDNSGSR